MPKAAAKLNLSQVGRVCVTVADTDRAIDFYVDTLGFEKVVDVPMGPDMRWVEVAITGTPTTIALAPPPEGQKAGGSQTGIWTETHSSSSSRRRSSITQARPALCAGRVRPRRTSFRRTSCSSATTTGSTTHAPTPNEGRFACH